VTSIFYTNYSGGSILQTRDFPISTRML